MTACEHATGGRIERPALMGRVGLGLLCVLAIINTGGGVQAAEEEASVFGGAALWDTSQFVLTTIGNPTGVTNLTIVPGGFDLTGAGNVNPTNTADQLTLAYQPIVGDFDLKVRLESVTQVDVWTEVGLMARETLEPESPYAAAVATPSVAGCYFKSRATNATSTTSTGSFPVNYPDTWLRLRRQGSVFIGYGGADGAQWLELGRITLAGAASPTHVGLFISSSSSSVSAVVKSRNWADASAGAMAMSTLTREPLGPSNRRGPVVISEIMYFPRFEGNSTNNLEFIELYNSQSWDEKVGGYRLSGAIDFSFPSNTVIRAGGFIVIAANPAAMAGQYGITGVLGPWAGGPTLKLPNVSGLIRLRGPADEVLWETEYRNEAPWPVAAAGAGHSLVLARPSYGESDPRAWEASDRMGGSPGRIEATSTEPLRSVTINEWYLNAAEGPIEEYVELYNASDRSVDLSGAYLIDDRSLPAYRFFPGETIDGRGFRSYWRTALGFSSSLLEGGAIYLVNSNQTRVVDAVRFGGQAEGIASGRYPDGAPMISELVNVTLAHFNGPALVREIVINELMYAPILGEADDEYVELHNWSETTIDVSGWRFTEGIDYTFSSGTTIASNGFLVVAKNVARLRVRYPHLSEINSVGNYAGSLANEGERVRLSMPRATSWVTVDEVTYEPGGHWGWWSAGGGGGLELMDPRSENRLPSNWADSDESGKASWTILSQTVYPGEPLFGASSGSGSGPIHNNLQIFMLGTGECLLDDVEVIPVAGGANLIATNADFESGLEGWVFHGSHDHSQHSTNSYLGSGSLHVRAASRGDNGPNKVRSPNFTTNVIGPIQIRAKARWIRGCPELVFRVHGGGYDLAVKLDVPSNMGTPGLVNSRRIANAGPAIWDVTHAPVLPQDGDVVKVTARINDPDDVAGALLRYRNDTLGGATLSAIMVDTGQNGDAVARDGLYTGVIPVQSQNTTIAFHISAVDGTGMTNAFPDAILPASLDLGVFPTDARSRELVVRWGDRMVPGTFGNYRLWLTRDNTARWRDRDRFDNAGMDATFVYNNYRVIYNVMPQYAGSLWLQGQRTSGPDGTQRVDYDVQFPPDDRFLNATHAVWVNPGIPQGPFTSDLSAQGEQTANLILKGMSLHYNYQRYVHVFVNGTHRSSTATFPGRNFIFEDVQRPDADTLRQWWPEDAEGALYRIDDWFEFGDTLGSPTNLNVGFANNDADLTRRTLFGTGQLNLAPYRFMFQRQTLEPGDSANDAAALVEILSFVSPNLNPTNAVIENLAGLESVVDAEQWMRVLAVQHAIYNWDTYGYERGNNASFYKPAMSRAQLLVEDFDFAMGIDRQPPPGLFISSDARVTAMWNTPALRRAYVRAFKDMADGVWNIAVLGPILDAKARALAMNNVAYNPSTGFQSVQSIKNYIGGMRSFLLTAVNSAGGDTAFTIQGATNFISSSNLLTLTGTAPIGLKDLVINGQVFPVTWLNVSTWSVRVLMDTSRTNWILQGRTASGTVLANAAFSIEYTGPLERAGERMVISEIMHRPAEPGGQYVELHNTSPYSAFDLAGWQIPELGFTFPSHSIIAAQGYLVVARHRGAFASAYGGHIPVTGTFDRDLDPAGGVLTLVGRGMPSALPVVINEVLPDPSPGTPWLDYVELYNLSDQDVDLTGCSLSDNAEAAKFVFDSGPILPPRGFLALDETALQFGLRTNDTLYLRGPRDNELVDCLTCEDAEPGVAYGRYPDGAASSGALQELSPALPNDPHQQGAMKMETCFDKLQRTDQVVDQVAYGSEAPWPTAVAGQDMALQLIDPDEDNSRVSNWSDGTGWGFFSRTGRLGPGATGLLFALANAGHLFIDEVSLIRLTGDSTNVNLVQNPGFESGSLEPWAGQGNHSNTVVTSSMAYSGASSMQIMASGSGSTVDYVRQGITGLDATNTYTFSFFYRVVAANNLKYRIGTSMQDFAVGLNVTPQFNTPGASNKGVADLPPYAPIWLSEVQPVNTVSYADRTGDFDPWIEIYNAGLTPISLAGYHLTDSYTNLARWSFPEGAAIEPRQFLLVWADGEPQESTPTEWHTNFRLVTNAVSIALARSLAEGRLQIVDYFNFGNLDEDASYGAYPEGQGLRRQVFPAATPGQANRPPPVQVFVNEWMARNSVWRDPADDAAEDWFELYNVSSQSVNLSGYYLSDDAQQPFLFQIPNGVVIEPRGYLLVWADGEPEQNGGASGHLHVNFNLDGDKDSIHLNDLSGRRINRVRFGLQARNISQGRYYDGGERIFSMPVATPGGPNRVQNTEPLVFVPLPTSPVLPGQSLNLQFQGIDRESPPQILTYSLEDGEPFGAVLDSVRGFFSWTPPLSLAGSTQWVTVRVTDDGDPPLSDTETFPIAVAALPRIEGVRWIAAGQIALSLAVPQGVSYRLEFKNDLNEPEWIPLETMTPVSDEVLKVIDDVGSAPQRFYRVVLGGGLQAP